MKNRLLGEDEDEFFNDFVEVIYVWFKNLSIRLV